MTLGKAKRTLAELAEKWGRDKVLFYPIDYYKINENGTYGYAELEPISVGAIVDSINDLGWQYKTLREIFDIRKIIKMLEKGESKKIYVYVPESYAECKEYHEKHRGEHSRMFQQFMTYLSMSDASPYYYPTKKRKI